jgi:hypothetical protein
MSSFGESRAYLAMNHDPCAFKLCVHIRGLNIGRVDILSFLFGEPDVYDGELCILEIKVF